MDDLTCQELAELVTDDLEDALPAAERARFEAHVAGCEACAAYLAQMRATIRLTLAAHGLDDRPEVAGLLEVFRDWKRRRDL